MRDILIGIIVIALVCVALVLLPAVINYIYYLDAPCDFFVVDLNVDDLVTYYASALSFLGTLILGMLCISYTSYEFSGAEMVPVASTASNMN